MKITKRSASLLALTAGLSLFVTASPANALGSTTSISDGKLTAKGVAVTLSYTFVCDAGERAHVGILLQQRVSQGRTAEGANGQFVESCTGEPQTSTVDIRTFDMAFKVGTALASVDLVTCSDFSCDRSPLLSKEIRLSNK